MKDKLLEMVGTSDAEDHGDGGNTIQKNADQGHQQLAYSSVKDMPDDEFARMICNPIILPAF